MKKNKLNKIFLLFVLLILLIVGVFGIIHIIKSSSDGSRITAVGSPELSSQPKQYSCNVQNYCEEIKHNG